MGIFDIFNNNAQKQAANSQISGINAGLAAGNNYFGQGANALNTNYSAGLQPFLQNYNQGQQGQTALANYLGLNGPQGMAAATAAFQNTPGYNFMLQQGRNAITANNAATGKSSSGAEDLALQNQAMGLANTTGQQYATNLMPFMSEAQQSAQGIGGLYSGLGNQLSNLYQNQGNMNYGGQTSIGNANANADMGNLTGSQNLWGFGMGAANLGAKMFAMSDGYVKDDIEKVGELYDGQNVYRYRFKGSPKHEIGLIAQEVEQRHPEAVREFGGIKHVNYEAATRPAVGYAKELLKFAA